MKVYTAFLMYPLANIHCTHKYLGEQTDEDFEAIYVLIENFINQLDKPKSPNVVDFYIRDYFGPRRNVPVLKPEAVDPAVFLLELRDLLEPFQKDKYGGFRPHVTTDENKIKMPFEYFALMHRDEVLQSWRLTKKSLTVR